MNVKILAGTIISLLAVAVAGCSQEQSQPASQGAADTSSTPASSADAPVSHLTQADIRVIAPAPAPEGQMPLYHTVGVDAVGAVTPMAGTESFTALIGSGDHDVTPMQEGCKFSIEVEVRNEKDAAAAPTVIKLPANEQNSVMLPGSELEERRVSVHMAADAQDNYSCNVMLRKKL